MSQSPPQQLFDGSYFEAILQTPALKAAPPDPEIASESDGDALPDFPLFDWDAYNREFFERIPDAAKKTARGREMAQIAGTQIWMARQFPIPVQVYLLANAPVKTLWQYLSGDDRKEVLKIATRGFQHTPQIIRQPVVRSRLLQWLQKHPEEIYILLMIWGLNSPAPPIIALAQGESDGAPLRGQLPVWIHNFGLETTIAGLSFAAKPRTLATLLGWLQNPAELIELIKNSEVEVPEIVPAPPEVDANAPDSEAAHFWRALAKETESKGAESAEKLSALSEEYARLNTQLRAQSAELEGHKQREKKSGALTDKKIGAAQTRLQSELDELKKSSERQGRKLRAIEGVKDGLEIENRRFKKQLRQTGMLLEEERRKVAALEARIAPAAPVEEISTPQSKQSAPGKVVVVQAPTPLDEIFEWRADGRLVRITARAVRRLIDQNDEEALFSILQALDSLQKSDKSLHGKFHKRLSDAGAYYARVLVENMTRVLVDASNVARYAPNKYGKGQLRHLLGMRDELRRLGCFPIVFVADASLRYFIDDAARFRDMVSAGEIQVVDKGVEADEILAREARRTGAYVVTNDAKFFHKVSPDFEPPRVTFRIYDGTVIVDEF